VKIKRLLSIHLIFIVLLSSLGFNKNFSSDESGIQTQQHLVAGTQLAEDAQDAIQVFRETLKITVSAESKSASFNLFQDSGRLIFTVIRYAKYNSYLLSQLSKNPSEKLFLEFRSLLI
jgi:hypothetical protein